MLFKLYTDRKHWSPTRLLIFKHILLVQLRVRFV